MERGLVFDRRPAVTATRPTATMSASTASRTIDLELLALDLATCTRCVGTLANLETAIETVRGPLESTGTAVRVRKVVVENEEQARRHRFVSSPTIRIAGRDIGFDALESPCDSCSDLCGCAEGTNCRVWRYQGREHTEAPVGLLVEALLRAVVATPGADEQPADSALPENLRLFFAGKAARADAAAACCSTAERSSCCAPAEKDSCCDPARPAACGCR
jgi:hypothetical protein